MKNIIKITGNLPHPSNNGYFLLSPFLKVAIKEVNETQIFTSLTAYSSIENARLNNEPIGGGEIYTKITPIPRIIYIATSVSDSNDIKVLMSIGTRKELVFNNAMEEVGEKIIQYGITSSKEMVTIKDGDTVLRTLVENPTSMSVDNTIDLWANLFEIITNIIKTDIEKFYEPLVTANLLTAEIVE